MKAAVLLLVVSLASAGAPSSELRVLFVGNSLTETNDLPAKVAALAEAKGRKLEYRTITFGGYSLALDWRRSSSTAASSKRRS
jgi:hypothetical protein